MKKSILLFYLLICIGCSNDDSTNEELQTQDPNATIADNVVVILTENSKLISSDSELSEGIYEIQFNQLVPEIEINDIIVGDEGLGFLRKVTSISSSDKVLTMQTSQANMEDVFGNININFSTDLSSFNRSSSNMYSQRMNYERFAEGVSRNQNNFALEFTNVLINSNSSSSFTITDGSMLFNPIYTFDLDYSFFSLDRFEFGTKNTTFNAQATLNLNTTDKVTLPLTEYVLYENSRTSVIPVGNIPVVVTLFLKIKAKSELEVGSTFSVSKTIKHNTTLSLGATYENNLWTPQAELDTEFVNHPVDLGGTYVSMTDKISFVPEIVIAFYGIHGPLIEPTFSGNFKINVGVNQNWDAFLNASTDLKLGASVGIFGKNLLSIPFDSYNIFTQPIWDAPATIAIVSGNNQSGNLGEQLAEPLKVKVLDNFGLFPIKEVPVYFEVTNGEGTVSAERVLTDDNGFAEVNWTLGDNIDEQLVEVTVKKADGTNIDSTATFKVENSKDRLFARNPTELIIVELDINTGNVISTIADINHGTTYDEFKFIQSTNELICSRSGSLGTYKINIDNGSFSLLTSVFYDEFVVDNINNRLFARNPTELIIVELDINTGNVISTIADINHGTTYDEFKFIQSTNELICSRSGSLGTYKINIDNGSFSLLTSVFYDEFVVDNVNNRLFARNPTELIIVELDINTGNVISTIADINHGTTYDEFKLLQSTNELICSRSGSLGTYKINIDNGSFSLLTSVFYDEFVVTTE